MRKGVKQLSMLETGYTWYEKFGFRNAFEQHRVFWMECIHLPFHRIYEMLPQTLIDEHKECMESFPTKYGLTDVPINIVFKEINNYLKNCPKENGNKCNQDEDFLFLSKFVKKSFQLLMVAVYRVNLEELKEIMEKDNHYFLSLYFPNETWIKVDGIIGKVVGIQHQHYKIQFHDGVRVVPIQNVKRLNNILLLEQNTKAKVIDINTDGYIVELKDGTRLPVLFKNVKIVGGTRKHRNKKL